MLSRLEEGIENFTHYYWKVQAIDEYGAIRNSDVWQFYTDDKDNPAWGALEVNVFDRITGLSINNASINIGNFSEVSKTSNGYALSMIPPAIYKISINAPQYLDAVYDNVKIPIMEKVTRSFELIPEKIPGDINKNNLIDLEDAILALKILSQSKMYVTELYTINADYNIGLSEAIYILQKIND